MKYAIVIPCGAVDEAVNELGDRTPLQAAELPTLDDLAQQGRIGTALTIPPDLPPAGEIALLSVLGYDPQTYPICRGPLEARAQGLTLEPDDQVFRCNLMTVTDGRLSDFAAGYIDSTQATRLLNDLNQALEDQQVRFYPGRSYRHLFVWKGCGRLSDLRTCDPQGILDEPISKHLPSGPGSEPLRQLIRWSQRQLAEHDVNIVRQDLGENPANCIWVHGHGPQPTLPAFQARFGVQGALVAGINLARGLGRQIGWEIIDVPGATGLIDTDLAAKGRAAVAALDTHDLVCVHVEALDEAGHAGNIGRKVSLLEDIDQYIVAPLIERLRRESDQRILIMPSHGTLVAQRKHSAQPTIFVIAGTGIESNRGEAFDEPNAEIGELHLDQACDLMDYFLHR